MKTRRDNEPSLESRLRADARATRVTPPEGLAQRISAAVWRDADSARHAPPSQPRRRSFRFLSPALAGLVTTACAIVLVVFLHDRTSTPGVSDADVRFLVDAVQTLPSRLASAELPVASTTAVTAPITRELDSVRADAVSALNFLAANFLPSQALERIEPTPEPPSTQGT